MYPPPLCFPCLYRSRPNKLNAFYLFSPVQIHPFLLPISSLRASTFSRLDLTKPKNRPAQEARPLTTLGTWWLELFSPPNSASICYCYCYCCGHCFFFFVFILLFCCLLPLPPFLILYSQEPIQRRPGLDGTRFLSIDNRYDLFHQTSPINKNPPLPRQHLTLSVCCATRYDARLRTPCLVSASPPSPFLQQPTQACEQLAKSGFLGLTACLS